MSRSDYDPSEMTQETAVELYALLTGIRISEEISEGVNDFIAYLERRIDKNHRGSQ